MFLCYSFDTYAVIFIPMFIPMFIPITDIYQDIFSLSQNKLM